jgi:hypothetical protein
LGTALVIVGAQAPTLLGGGTRMQKDADEETTKRTIAYVVYRYTVEGNGITATQLRKLLGLADGTVRTLIDKVSITYPLYIDGKRYKMEDFHALNKKRAKNTGKSESRVRQGEGGRNLLQDGELGQAWSSSEKAALAADAEAARFIRALKTFQNHGLTY